jgi:hypothetical protein
MGTSTFSASPCVPFSLTFSSSSPQHVLPNLALPKLYINGCLVSRSSLFPFFPLTLA